MSDDIKIGRCIYCGTVGTYSEEHYLPECLGKFRNYELVIMSYWIIGSA
jgi:hypothetical protein